MKRLLMSLLAVLRGRSMDRELDEELASHLELAAAENRRNGMSSEDARRAATASLGGVAPAREAHRDARGLPLLETLWQDVRYSFRTLRRDAGLALFAILITGLGVGASATVFSVVNTILLRSLPLSGADRLAWIANLSGEGLSGSTVQVGQLQELQAHNESFSDVAAYFAFYGAGDMQLTGIGAPERLTGVPVTGNFLPVLGVDLHLGRNFTKEEAQFNGPPAVILSHLFWARRMNSDPNVIGRALTLNNRSFTIAGVLPASFDFGALFAPGQNIDLIRPFPLAPQTHRQGNTLSIVGRLKPGVSTERAQAELTVFGQRMRREHSDWNNFTPGVSPFREHLSGGIKPAMFLLSGAVGLVMLIVCANLSNLLLARATARRQEMSIRVALGAGRGRLIRQMLVESLLLSSVGSLLGLGLAFGGTRLLAGLETNVPLLAGVQLDWIAVWFSLAVAVATGIGFGLLPALRVTRLEASNRGASAGREHTRIRGGLVVGEVALACMLLVGSGLLIRSFLRVLDVDLGFQPQHAMSLRIDPARRFENAQQRDAYFREVLKRVGSAAGIEVVGLTDVLPLGTNRSWGAGAKGKVYTRENYPDAFVRIVSDGYFRSMGISMRQGRDFAATDNFSSPRVIIINETLARTLWPGEDPIGKVMQVDGDRQVAGVVRDVRHLALEKEAGGEMYLPIWQTGDYSKVDLVVRGTGAQRDLEGIVREQLRAIDPTLPATAFRSLQGLVDRSVSPRRLIVLLLGGFAGFALILASLGIYGVISYSVTQRQKELGIRMALGATGSVLRGQILGQTLRLTAIGLVLGLLASWGLLRLLQGMLFGVTASDPMTFGGALLLLTAVAALAGYVPAIRASRLNPVEALRMD